MSNNYTSRMEKRQQRKKPKGRKGNRWKKILLGLGIAFALILVGGGVAVGAIISKAPELKADNLTLPQSTRIYDEDGKKIDTLFQEENRINVSIEDVPDEMKNAIISIEDKRFYEHNGIDWHRLFGAALSNIKNGWGAEGGSTLTQQVIKRTVLTPEKTLTRKIQEAWLARKLEKKYSKDEILELYLNNVYFGHGAYGLRTAAVTYFGEEDLSKLDVSQAALLAGLPNSPSATDPFKYPEQAGKRRDQVLSSMVNNGFITEAAGEEAKNEKVSDLVLDEEKTQENDNPYNAYVDAVYDQLVKVEKVVTDEEFFQGGLEIYTHLDAEAQKATYNLLHSDDIPYPDENFEAGISLVDTETGAIKAIGGGRNFKAISYTNYGSNVKHQPGSTIKPIVDYGPVIEHLNWSTAYVLADEPYEYEDGQPVREWDDQYWGDVSLRRALEWSRNIPAIKAFNAVGEDKAQAFASGLGIEIDPIYESAAIGGFEGVSPLQMASAYAAFGNGGTYNEPSSVKKVVFPDGKEWEAEVTSEKAMEDYTAYMVTDMLKSVVESGTGTKANVEGLPIAGKTGSTNFSKEKVEEYNIQGGFPDSWFTGFTTEYSLGVWTGYPSMKSEDGEVQYIKNDGTQDIAKQLFRELMSQVSSSDVADFTQPDSVVTVGSELYVRGADVPVPEPKPEPEPAPTEEPEEEPVEEPEEEPEEEEEEEPEEEEDAEENQEENNEEENGQNDGDANNDQQNNENNGNNSSDNDQQNNQNNDSSNDQQNQQNNDNGQNNGNNESANRQNGNKENQNRGNSKPASTDKKENGNQGENNNQEKNNE